jgi:anti-sigma regulatory factor (Ser/Thr protein kinase)
METWALGPLLRPVSHSVANPRVGAHLEGEGGRVDWYVPRHDVAAITALRHQVRDYLARHAAPDSDLSVAELVFQELVVNAIEHTGRPAWVQLTWVDEHPDVTVWDLGPGFDPAEQLSGRAVAEAGLDPADTGAWSPYDTDSPALLDEGGRGLFLVTHLAEAFEVAAREAGGTRVRATLPVSRASSRSIVPARVVANALPELDEAAPEGGFSRDVFLRALVVQLSQAMEHVGGPDLSEDVVSEVGITVGGRMEEEYRAAKDVVDRLDPTQLADCFVRLKHAIDGDFYIVEVSDDRIVLGNHRCPFGNAVRRSPALCRMTSAVFGGIAARNHDDGSAVVLEERIAVGDPGCRVVVHLGQPPESSRRFAHRYHAPGQPQPVDA